MASCVVAALLATSGCALLPDELNLSPLYRHRRDEAGKLLELDVLWPIVHYERTPTGGDDFRIRPLWRWITEEATVEHQFLWPLGHIESDATETMSRFFPLWFWVERLNQNDQVEVDWYALFPFLWGGTREDGKEQSFAVLPFYADLHDWFFHDRFQSVLFPLWVHTRKDHDDTTTLLWPLIQWGGSSKPNGGWWWRVLPFYGEFVRPGKFERYTVLWPFVNWSYEAVDTAEALHTVLVWPFYGRQWSDTGKTTSWTVLWPFFRGITVEGRRENLDLLWPVYHSYRDDKVSDPITQWWVWPFVARTETDDQMAWSFLWPLIWWRWYYDPEGVQTQQWVLPFYWHVHRDYTKGGEADFTKLWPLVHEQHDDQRGDGETQMFSPWPWREAHGLGVDENYGWLWTLFKARKRAPGDTSFSTALDLFTTRTRKQRTQTSVPFLFNYESDADGSVLRLFQVLPIRLSGGAKPAAPATNPSSR